MKKKGFTLAELLGVITLLGLLALIVIPIVDKTLKEGKDDLYESQIKMIEASAQMWGNDNLDLLPENIGTGYVTLSTLQDSGYLDEEIKNTKTGKSFEGSLQIKITGHGTYYTYEVMDD